MKKNPILAALLNLIPGLGYLYLGVRRVFAVMLLTGSALAVIDALLNPSTADSGDITFNDLSGYITMMILGAFVVDAYIEAKRQQKVPE